jgi:DNA-binding NtrC family response regulator
VVALTSGEEAIKLLETDAFDLVLTDLRMEKVDGMMLLTKTRELYPDTEVVMITGYATVDSAIAAMKAGAYHYIAKPFKLDEVRKVVREALEKIGLKRENRVLRTQMNLLSADSGVITNNRDMKAILKTASHAALCDSNIVLSGESGTGKELLARYIHAASIGGEGISWPSIAVPLARSCWPTSCSVTKKVLILEPILSKKDCSKLPRGGPFFLTKSPRCRR